MSSSHAEVVDQTGSGPPARSLSAEWPVSTTVTAHPPSLLSRRSSSGAGWAVPACRPSRHRICQATEPSRCVRHALSRSAPVVIMPWPLPATSSADGVAQDDHGDSTGQEASRTAVRANGAKVKPSNADTVDRHPPPAGLRTGTSTRATAGTSRRGPRGERWGKGHSEHQARAGDRTGLRPTRAKINTTEISTETKINTKRRSTPNEDQHRGRPDR